MTQTASFPPGFIWGASSSSYQTEGGNEASALWDWERRRGWERSGAACQSWDRFEEDLACLKALGLKAFRFSLEWSRVEPESGRFDAAALARYASWAARLREESIRPIVCFHHFSEPAWLLRRFPRGWADSRVADAFVSFVERAAAALAGSVGDWLTFNEPMVFITGAYGARYFPPGGLGLLAPGLKLNSVIVPNMARAHNDAYRLLKALQPAARVGVAHHLTALEPARPGDEAAVARWDWYMHRQWLERTKDCLDFLGVNYYSRIFVSSLLVGPMGTLPGYAEIARGLGPAFRLLGGRRDKGPRTGMDWEVVPEGLERVVLDAWKSWGKPLWITENGLAVAPGVTREAFLRGHLAALSRAMAQGARVEGYLHWSLLDNYEWGSYKPRFGLFDARRRPNEGAAFYADVAKGNGF